MKVPSLDAKAKDVMQSRVMTATRQAKGRDMAVHFLSGMFSGLPVIEASNRELVGVVSEFDLLKAVQEGKDLDTVKADDIMTKPPITVEEETAVKHVLEQMIKWNILRVPVVREKKLVGVISRTDLLNYIIPSHVICAYL